MSDDAQQHIAVPQGLRARLAELVKKQAAELRTTEAHARRAVEISVLQCGLAALEGNPRGQTRQAGDVRCGKCGVLGHNRRTCLKGTGT
jgi:hypothetical protein